MREEVWTASHLAGAVAHLALEDKPSACAVTSHATHGTQRRLAHWTGVVLFRHAVHGHPPEMVGLRDFCIVSVRLSTDLLFAAIYLLLRAVLRDVPQPVISWAPRVSFGQT